MSTEFSDTTNKDGLIQFIEDTLGFPDGHISGDTTRLRQWTAKINLVQSRVWHAILASDGKWQWDDSNHTTYPILTGNLVDGQRDYSFTADSDGNLVLDIHRVFLRMSSTDPYYEIFPRDVQSDSESVISGFVDGLNTEGRPSYYDKTATGIFLDPIPNASVTSGLKVYVSREGSSFSTGDTTKKPGFAGLYHELLVLEACYRYARANSLVMKNDLKADIKELKADLQEFYSKRDFHDVTVMSPEPIIYE